MKLAFPSLLIIVSFINCSKGNFHAYIKNKTDTITITCKKLEEKKEIHTITDKNKISSLISYISKVKTPFYKCGHTGSIVFYRNKKSLINGTADFNYHESCAHITLFHDKKLFSYQITNEGRIYLKGLCGE